LEQLTAGEIAEWEAYDRLDPIGDGRTDLHFAILMSQITNLFIGAYGKKGAKITKPEDYIIDWSGGGQEKDAVQQSVDDMKSFMLSFAKSHNESLEKSEKRKRLKK